jgi:hypothetical protein
MSLRAYKLMVHGKVPLLDEVPSAADDSDDEKETINVEKKAETQKVDVKEEKKADAPKPSVSVTKTTQPPQHTAQTQLILKQFRDRLSAQERKLDELTVESKEIGNLPERHLKHIELNSYYFSKDRPASREAARQEMKNQKLYESYTSFSRAVENMVSLYKEIDAYFATSPQRLLDAKFQKELAAFKSKYEKFKGNQESQHAKFVKYNEKVKDLLAVVVAQEEPVVVADLVATAAVEAPKQMAMA